MHRKLSARIGSIFLVIHGLIEISGFVLMNSIPFVLISFGGLSGPDLEQNTSAITLFGVLWGTSRIIAAWGIWSLRKWGLLLGMILSIVTMVASITIIPAGVTDTFFAMPVLILSLYSWFGNEVKETIGG